MNAAIANSLVAENQYSSVPKALTLNIFTPIRKTDRPMIHTTAGTSGNHIRM
ncbi:hypothetical protein D3C74_408490 [compost metagenome]